MISIEPQSFILAVFTAIASGVVGSFALMRRMTLAGDAFSHVALPGIGVALLYSFNPVLGGAAALFMGTLIIWKVERLSPLNTEAIIGVLFALSLAIGAIAIGEEHELVEALFGGITPVTAPEFILGSLIAIFVTGFIVSNRHALILLLVSKELAKTAAIPIDRLQFLFLLMFALTVILGMKFLGVLLMGSLIIIPAAIARNVAQNLSGMLVIASGSAVASVILGILASQFFEAPLGPTIIIIAGILFVASLVSNVFGASRRVRPSRSNHGSAGSL